MNATPQQMSQAQKEVENFIRNVGRSKKERKPVRPHVVEVIARLMAKQTPAVVLIFYMCELIHFPKLANVEVVIPPLLQKLRISRIKLTGSALPWLRSKLRSYAPLQ